MGLDSKRQCYSKRGDISKFHERTPVVMNPVHWLSWLDSKLKDLLAVQHIVDRSLLCRFETLLADLGTEPPTTQAAAISVAKALVRDLG